MSASYHLFAWVSCFGLGLALGPPALGLELSVAAIPNHVSRHNPSLSAARARVEEARGRLLQAGRRSNPEAGFEFKSDDQFREGAVTLSIDQRFPITARLRLEKEVSGQEVTAAELEVEEEARKLTAQAQDLAVKLLAVDQQEALRVQQSKLARELSEFAAKRADAGEISPLDAAQAQMDAQKALLESRTLAVERTSLTGELKPLLGMAPGETLRVEGGLQAFTVPGKNSAWENRADYRRAKLKEQSALMAIALAQAGRWEDISAGVFVEGERENDDSNGLERKPFIGIRFSVPLQLWNKNEGRIQEVTAASRRAELETKALGLAIQNEVAAARADMAAQQALAQETLDKLLPLVLQQTERLEKAYEQGQTDLMTVLRAREQRLQLELAVINARRDFHLARIRYESAVGQHSAKGNKSSNSKP